MVRVLVADDHAVVRRGLRQMFEASSDIEVAGEAATGSEVLSHVERGSYDAVLLDISMPGRNGLEVLKQIRAMAPGLPVIIFSMHPGEDYAVRCLKAGAAAYLTKDSAAEEILAAVRRVARGGRYLNPALLDKLPLGWESRQDEPQHARLSDREFEVMCLCARGMTTAQIAEELSLSAQTISTYKTRILEKMKLPSFAHVIRYAVEHGLVP